MNRDCEAGIHSVQWDCKNLDDQYITNGLYVYCLQAGDFNAEKVMCLNMTDPEAIRENSCIPIISSNNQGEFFIAYTEIPIGEKINHTNADGPEVLGELILSNKIDLVLLKEGYQTLVQSLEIDVNKMNNLQFQLIPN